MSMLSRSFERSLPWALFVLAFALRLFHLAALSDDVPHHFVFNDSFVFNYYGQITADPSQARPEAKDPIPVAPLYVSFLAALYKCLGYNPLWPKLVQIFLGSLVPVFFFRLVRGLWGLAPAVLAGLFAACDGIFIFYDTEIMKTSLSNFFLAATLYLALRKSGRGPVPFGSILALPAAGAILLREHLLILIPLLSFWLLWRYRSLSLWKALAGLGTFLVSSALFLVLGSVTLGSFIVPVGHGVGSTAGINFYIGNNPRSNGAYTPVPGLAPYLKAHYTEAKQLAEIASQRPLSWSGSNLYWFQRGWLFIAQEPAQWFPLFLKKIFLSFNNYEIPIDENYPDIRYQSWVLQLPLISFGFLFMFAAGGLALPCAQAKAERNFLLCFVLTYTLILSLLFVQSTYRLPLHSGLIPLATIGLAGLWEALLRRRFLRLVLALGVLTAAAYFTFLPNPLKETGFKAKLERRIALLQANKGREADTLIQANWRFTI